MKWPVPTESFTASNGLVITPIGSTEDAIRHGRTMRNGLEVPGTIYHEIAASGGNLIFSIASPEGDEIASGSIKVGLDGNSFVNFVRGRHNSARSENSAESIAAQEFSTAINTRSIDLKTIPTQDGLFIKLPEAEPAPALEAPAQPATAPQPEHSVISTVMSAFQRIFRSSRADNATAPAPQDDQNAPGQAVAVEAPVEFMPREIGDSAWPSIASPGQADANGLSVVVATDERTLRFILEQCECRMMWERPQVLRAIQNGEVQIGAIYDASKPDPVVGYTVLTAQQGILVASDIVGRFEKRPTPEMIMSVSNWVGSVNRLQPGQVSDSGIERHIGLNGPRFSLPNIPDYIPEYDETGRLVPDAVYSPGRAMATRYGGPAPLPAIDIPVELRAFPSNLGGIQILADKFAGWETELNENSGNVRAAITSGSYLPVEVTLANTDQKERVLLHVLPEGEVEYFTQTDLAAISPEMRQSLEAVNNVTSSLVSMALATSDIEPNAIFSGNVENVVRRGDFSAYTPRVEPGQQVTHEPAQRLAPRPF